MKDVLTTIILLVLVPIVIITELFRDIYKYAEVKIYRLLKYISSNTLVYISNKYTKVANKPPPNNKK